MEIGFRGGALPKSQQTQKSPKWKPEPLKSPPGFQNDKKIITFASQHIENPIAETIQKCKNYQIMKPTKRHGGGIARSALNNKQIRLLIHVVIKSFLDCYWIAWIANHLLDLSPTGCAPAAQALTGLV